MVSSFFVWTSAAIHSHSSCDNSANIVHRVILFFSSSLPLLPPLLSFLFRSFAHLFLFLIFPHPSLPEVTMHQVVIFSTRYSIDTAHHMVPEVFLYKELFGSAFVRVSSLFLTVGTGGTRRSCTWYAYSRIS